MPSYLFAFIRSSGALVLYAFCSGLAYVGLQALFLDRITIISREPRLALILTMNLFLLTSAAACFLIEWKRLERPGLALRMALSGLVFSSATAYVGLAFLAALPKSGIVLVWLASALLFLPATCAGLAFGAFFQIVAFGRTRIIPLVLLAAAGGSLLAGLQAKALAAELGFSMVFGAILAIHVAMAVLLPASNSSADRTPETF